MFLLEFLNDHNRRRDYIGIGDKMVLLETGQRMGCDVEEYRRGKQELFRTFPIGF